MGSLDGLEVGFEVKKEFGELEGLIETKSNEANDSSGLLNLWGYDWEILTDLTLALMNQKVCLEM